jgi:hypothetical protein
MQPDFRHLLTGHDTVECAYYFTLDEVMLIDYEALAAEKENLRRSKSKNKPIKLGSEEFLLTSHGTKSGYPFLIENDVFSIQFGEFNKPNFLVTFSSHALWHNDLLRLHNRFMEWAKSVGLRPYAVERLSRVDFTFDYQISEIDFDEDNFTSRAIKDAQYRKSRKVQTFQFGSSDIRLRMYNKCDEIEEKSRKTWLYDIWKVDNNVWRIEWQVRKLALRSMDIISIESLYARQADLLKNLVNNHTTLRIESEDSNLSRRSWHPLWLDLEAQIEKIEQFGTARKFDMQRSVDEQLLWLSVSVYGYLKRIAAINCQKAEIEEITVDDTISHLSGYISKIHEPFTWNSDVAKRVNEMRLRGW